MIQSPESPLTTKSAVFTGQTLDEENILISLLYKIMFENEAMCFFACNMAISICTGYLICNVCVFICLFWYPYRVYISLEIVTTVS